MSAVLEPWGWDERWAAAFAAEAKAGELPARIVEERRGVFRAASADGERPARTPGSLRYKTDDPARLPAVGDWVRAQAVRGERTLLVRGVLPRRTKLSRKAAGETLTEQVIAANVDAVLVMTAMNAEFNPRRLERFLSVCRESGAEPVVVLNKADACPDTSPFAAEARAVAGGAPVVAVSAKTGEGLAALGEWIRTGRTVGLVGSSGVGKSTLVNRLSGGELMGTAETRASDERGRHTTTHRQLFILPGGGVILDTPGMREMQFWDAERGVAGSFDEIESLAPSCRFRDCAHGSEPGCAVKAAVEAGTVAPERLESWRKLKKEAKFEARRVDPALEAEKKRKDKEQTKALDKRVRGKRRPPPRGGRGA